jgi:hypothetical protein
MGRPAAAPGPALAELPTPAWDPERVRQTADEVLSRPEYDGVAPSLLERAQIWVTELLGRAFAAAGSTTGGAIAAVVVLLAVVAVVAWLVVRFIRRIGTVPSRDEPVVTLGARTGDQWRADADAVEGDGRWREALRCRYRALLADLAGRGLVTEVAGRTTGEYLAELSARLPDAQTAFTEATRGFESAWYGGTAVERDDVAAVRDAAARVLTVAGGDSLASAAGQSSQAPVSGAAGPGADRQA